MYKDLLYAAQIVDETPEVDNKTAVVIHDAGTFVVAKESFKLTHEELEWWVLPEKAIANCLATDEPNYLQIKNLLTND